MHMKKKKLIWTEYAKNRQNMSASRGDMLAFTGMKYQSCDIKDLKFLVFLLFYFGNNLESDKVCGFVLYYNNRVQTGFNLLN